MIKIHNCQDHFHLYCEQPVILNFFEKLSEVRFGDWQVRDCKVVTQGVTLFNSGVTTWRNSHQKNAVTAPYNFHLHGNKANFHKKGFALGLALKQR